MEPSQNGGGKAANSPSNAPAMSRNVVVSPAPIQSCGHGKARLTIIPASTLALAPSLSLLPGLQCGPTSLSCSLTPSITSVYARPQYESENMTHLTTVTTSSLDVADGHFDNRKKPRTVFSPKQIIHLEEKFAENKFPTLREREEICKDLSLSHQVVMIWFQNRRAKSRRRQRRMQSELHLKHSLKPPPFWPQHLPFHSNFTDVGTCTKGSDSDSNSSTSTTLNHIESSSEKEPSKSPVSSPHDSPPHLSTTSSESVPSPTQTTAPSVHANFVSNGLPSPQGAQSNSNSFGTASTVPAMSSVRHSIFTAASTVRSDLPQVDVMPSVGYPTSTTTRTVNSKPPCITSTVTSRSMVHNTTTTTDSTVLGVAVPVSITGSNSATCQSKTPSLPAINSLPSSLSSGAILPTRQMYGDESSRRRANANHFTAVGSPGLSVLHNYSQMDFLDFSETEENIFSDLLELDVLPSPICYSAEAPVHLVDHVEEWDLLSAGLRNSEYQPTLLEPQRNEYSHYPQNSVPLLTAPPTSNHVHMQHPLWHYPVQPHYRAMQHRPPTILSNSTVPRPPFPPHFVGNHGFASPPYTCGNTLVDASIGRFPNPAVSYGP